ncbi:hypothetical protein [Nocardia wallacei]|uniref:hypothetical protein n=1 Tax=Nocardia wallacei TaxID=480035 RepID=UPI002457481E|nr:hypothetical protein [Nocardia wallacei]
MTPTATDAAALTSAQALATRHLLRIEGFDHSGITEDTVRELAAAVDHVLGTYRFLRLQGISITDLGGSAVCRAGWTHAESTRGKPLPWLHLDRSVIDNAAKPVERYCAAEEFNGANATPVARPLYSAVITAFGQIMVKAAGPRPLRLAQRFLITEYQRISGPWDDTDRLARIVRGYREWRAQLPGHGQIGGLFDPPVALAAAFTEVEMRGEAAGGPAKVLHRLLVEAVREGSKSQ